MSELDQLVGSHKYSLSDLAEWDARIREKVTEFGLDPFPQEFEICDFEQMIGYMAYSGMPSHFPHWSYGKSYEKTRTLYDHGVTGLPYEMVINSNPALGYLMRQNSLLLQILTIAHVYGHNDFFKNNATFRYSRPEETIGWFKSAAERIRGYQEEHGERTVEDFLDAAQSLAFNRSYALGVKTLSREEQIERIKAQARESVRDSNPGLHKPKTIDEKKFKERLQRRPLEPEPNILTFIAEENPLLEDWQRDILYIVDREAQYFIPQIQTKIMNEGWASHWHHRIVRSLGLPQELWTEFAVRHSQVVRPHQGSINPYHIGFTMWDAIKVYYDGVMDPASLDESLHQGELFRRLRDDFEFRDAVPHDAGKVTGDEKIFSVRSQCNDRSFIERFLSRQLIRELDLFHYEDKGNDEQYRYVVAHTGNDKGWKKVRDEFARQVGGGRDPVIHITDALHQGNKLYVVHEWQGQELEIEYAKKVVTYLRRLWMRPVILETQVGGKKTLITLQNFKDGVKVKTEK